MYTNPLDEIRLSRQLAERRSSDYQREWLEGLKFVGDDGKILDKDRAVKFKAIEVFLGETSKEARRTARSVEAKLDMGKLIKDFNLTRSDAKSFDRWKFNPPPTCLGKYHGLTKRANRMARHMDRVVQEIVTKKLDFYKLIAPHTFCFAPEGLENSSWLEQALGKHLFDEQSYCVDEKDRWVKSHWFEIYKNNGHKIRFIGYFLKSRPVFKIKMYSKRQFGSEEDILDLEAKFEERKFVGLVHYHVVKPFTHKILSDGKAEKFAPPYSFEMRRSKNDDLVLKTVSMDGREEKMYTDKEKMEKRILATALWNSNPVVAGGELFERVLKIIENEPKYQAMQHHVVKCFRGN